jgi:cytochrome P450
MSAATPVIDGPGPAEATRLLYTLAIRRPLDFFTRLADRYGDTVRVRFSRQATLYLLTRPEHVEHVLVSAQDNYPKAFTYRPIRALIGDGLLTSEGERWRRHRRLIQPMFARRHVTGFAPQMTGGAARMLARWDALGPEPVVNVSAEISALTLDVVGRVLFSADLSQDAADLGKALTKGQRAVVLSLFLPVSWGPRSTRAVLTATNGFGGAVAGIQDPVRRLVAQRRSAPPPDQPRDLLDLLIAARADDGSPLTDLEIREEVATFMLAGHETTATALAWTLALLSANPRARDRLEDEIAEVLGEREPEADDFDRLPWTRAVVSEAMRLYPPAWTMERGAADDDEIGGIPVARGSTVAVPPYLIHRHPDFWPEPARFDPSRFLPGADPGRPRYSYIPFGGGRRGCVGAMFAQIEATLMLAMIARRYRLDLTVRGFPVPNAGITLRPGRTLPMRLRRLNLYRPNGQWRLRRSGPGSRHAVAKIAA